MRDQIRQIESARLDRLEHAPGEGAHAMVRLLARVMGIGIETADMLVREVLSRNLRDRRAVARYASLTGSPDERGRSAARKGWRDPGILGFGGAFRGDVGGNAPGLVASSELDAAIVAAYPGSPRHRRGVALRVTWPLLVVLVLLLWVAEIGVDLHQGLDESALQGRLGAVAVTVIEGETVSRFAKKGAPASDTEKSALPESCWFTFVLGPFLARACSCDTASRLAAPRRPATVAVLVENFDLLANLFRNL